MPKSRLKVLVLSDFSGVDANVVRDFLYCFNQHSKHQFYYLHAWSKNQCRRLQNFDFGRFDAIVLFWDFFWIGCDDPLSYCYVPKWVSDRIAESRAVKIQFLQDEYRDVLRVNRVMSRFGVNVMFTCTAPRDHELFYPKSRIPSLVATYPVLTGYVPTYLEKVHYPASIERPIDIGYRSRQLPYYLGNLGQEKVIIADRFQEIAARYGFKADISVKEKDRIYGEDWLTFMKACRFSLGTESGASVVDFDGQIRRRTQDYVHDHPNASFEEVQRAIFGDVDGKVVVQTISPRIFEASAFENTLILHEGHYEGMLQPDVHYISVKKDYSNIPEVVERMRDRPFCERLARAAKETLIDSRQYNYESFVKQFDAVVEKHVPAPAPVHVSRTMFYLVNYLNNDRLLPHEGKFLTVPKTCDLVFHYNKVAPYVMVWSLSLRIILDLASQFPRFVAELIRQVVAGNGSAAGLIRDLRILALLVQTRRVKRGPLGLAYDVELAYDAQANRLVANSVPCVNDPWVQTPPAPVREEAPTEPQFTLTWETRLLSNALPLCEDGDNRYCIFLDDDCLYRFDTLNALRSECSDELNAAFQRVLFGAWEQPSWASRARTALALGWTLIGSLCQRLHERFRRWLGAERTAPQETTAPTP